MNIEEFEIIEKPQTGLKSEEPQTEEEDYTPETEVE